MTFRLVPKSVTLNDLERRNGRYFALFQRIFMYDVAVKQLLGLQIPRPCLFGQDQDPVTFTQCQINLPKTDTDNALD